MLALATAVVFLVAASFQTTSVFTAAGSPDTAAKPAKANIYKLQHHHIAEVRSDASSKGDLCLEEFKKSSSVSAASFKGSKAAQPSKSNKSDKKLAEPITLTPKPRAQCPTHVHDDASKRTLAHKSTANLPSTASMLQCTWLLTTYTGILAIVLAMLAAVGGYYIRAARSKQYTHAKTKKNHNTMHSYASLVHDNILIFGEEAYDALRKRVDDLQKSPLITMLLDYADGKATKFSVATTDWQDVPCTLLMEMEAEVGAKPTAKTTSRKHKRGAKVRRANKQRETAAAAAAAAAAVAETDGTAHTVEGSTTDSREADEGVVEQANSCTEPCEDAANGEWLAAGSGSRRNRGQRQNNNAKQLLRQQLLRKTTDALFVGHKAASYPRWDNIETAAMKRIISGVPHPLTVSPDTAAASTTATRSPAGELDHADRTLASSHPLLVRPSAVAVANMHNMGIETAAPAHCHTLVQAPQHPSLRTLSSGDYLWAHHHQQWRTSDEGEQSSLTDSDTSDPNFHGYTTQSHIPAMHAGQVPRMPNPMEANSVYQYCSMLQDYYQQQCNMMTMPPGPVPRMPQPMHQVPMPMQFMPMPMQVPVMAATQNAMFPPLYNSNVQRVRSVSAEYFQPIHSQAMQPAARQHPFGSISSSAPSSSPYYSSDLYENRFTPSPGLSLSSAMQAGSGITVGAIGPTAMVQREELQDAVVVAALQKQIEYYFSADNLVYDTYLHGLMDGEGFVHLSEIANFRRVVKLNVNARQMLVAVYSSAQLEVVEPTAEPAAQILDYEGRLLRTRIRRAVALTR